MRNNFCKIKIARPCLGEVIMIEDYIEKDIIRKVKLVEFSYDNKKIKKKEKK